MQGAESQGWSVRLCGGHGMWSHTHPVHPGPAAALAAVLRPFHKRYGQSHLLSSVGTAQHRGIDVGPPYRARASVCLNSLPPPTEVPPTANSPSIPESPRFDLLPPLSALMTARTPGTCKKDSQSTSNSLLSSATFSVSKILCLMKTTPLHGVPGFVRTNQPTNTGRCY